MIRNVNLINDVIKRGALHSASNYKPFKMGVHTMNEYTIIGIDLAKTKFHVAALDKENKVVMKRSINRKDFIEKLGIMFAPSQIFTFEACAGCHNICQILTEAGHKVIALEPKDVKAYAKSRQKMI